ncbi:MAG: carboxypeptidase regulatory-like domain-containing protein [Blastocatellia bacterium]|nr:carboxypeptidase regulatory-like domain-containing protein [Blastocatellia bacterium]
MLKRLSAISLMFVLTAFLIVGCNGGGEKNGEPANSGKKEYAPTGDEGTITGTIAFEGTAPARKTIPMGLNDANCATIPGEKLTENVIVKDGKLANVFVFIKGGPAGDYSFKTPSEAATLDQKGCRYHPHVFGVQTGQTIKILNSDNTTHNIHPSPKNNKEFNEVQGPGAAPKEKTFMRAETLIPVKCNQHPWMQAYIGVLEHPFFAVSKEDGTYEIEGLPPGDYTVETWHEQYGKKEQKVTVAAKGSVTQDFTYKDTDKAALSPSSLKMQPALVLP